MVDILIIGATGFTGRLTAQYLASHPQAASFSWGIAGRSKNKLNELANELKLPKNVSIYQVDASNGEQVDAAVKQAKVVISAVGPFMKWGTPIVRACVRNHVHYVDITGEPHWIYDIIQEFDYVATKSRTILIPGCGIDSIPSDLSVFLSRQTLSQYSPGQLQLASSVTAWDLRTSISGGSINTMITLIEEGTAKMQQIMRGHYSLSPIIGAPSPPLRLSYGLQVPGEKPIPGGFFVMLLSNRAIVHRTAGLLELAGLQHASPATTAATYGSKFTYDEFMVSSSKLSGVLTTIGLLCFQVALTIAPLRWLIKKFLPQPGEGSVDEALRSKKRFLKTVNHTQSVVTPLHPEPVHVKTTMHAEGDAYLITAVLVGESALSILLAKDELPDIGKRGGILTPMSALGNVLIERLRNSGMKIESGVVSVGNKRTA